MTSDAWNESSLAAWVPVEVGDRVAVAGSHPPLMDALERAGADVRRCHRAVELAAGAQGAIHHLVVPDLSDVPDILRGEVVSHAVRPGGTVLVGTAHRRRRHTGHTVRSLRAALADCGVGRVDVFAVRQGLSNPRAIVPVGDRILRWYVTTSFLPRSRRESVLASGLQLLRPGRVTLPLFPALMARGEAGDL